METSKINSANKQQVQAARTKLADDIIAYAQIASDGELRKAVWILSGALRARFLTPKGRHIGRNWYSSHDQLLLVKPTGNQPYRQREFCCSARFLFLLCDELKLSTIDELVDAAILRPEP
jgi:hypothetical protein